MNRQRTAVNDMRLNRKRFHISESLLPLVLLLVLLVAQTSGRPSSMNGTTKHDVKPASRARNDGFDDTIDDVAFDADAEYADVDNVEWHHVKMVDGIMHEDHPIIMYKEDFVSADYDPSQHNGSSDESSPHARRKYKHLQRQRPNNRTLNTQTQQQNQEQNEETKKYHALKPEKIYFDILPPTPVVLTDDSSINDSKFDPGNVRVKVISLLDDEDAQLSLSIPEDSEIEEENDDARAPSKELLHKRPKKYYRRIRRDTESHYDAGSHMVYKRQPSYIYERIGANSFDDYAKHKHNYWGQKHAVAGNKWNGIDGDVPPPTIDFANRFGGEDNTDRVIWGVVRRGGSRRPLATTRPASTQEDRPNFPSLIHNSNPEDADLSRFTTRRPVHNGNRRPNTSRPQQEQMPQFPPLIHNSNPENADWTAFTHKPPPQQQQQVTSRPAQRQPSSSGSSSSSSVISQCVYAIVNCCPTSDTNIPYSCFEQFGCIGAFWDRNPCGESVKSSVLDYIERTLN